MTFFMTYGRQGTPEEVKAARECWTRSAGRPLSHHRMRSFFRSAFLKSARAMNKVMTDETMAQADKDAKIKELQAQKAEFEKLMGEVPQT